MLKKTYSAIFLLSLAAPTVVFAAEEATEVHGLIELGVRGVDSNANSSKFQEFKDMGDGIFGQILLDADKGDYHFQFDALNPGADDQSFQVKGGQYDSFKYQFDYNEMVHNYTFGAITPATGIGTQHISFPVTTSPDIPPLSQWTPFDYKVNHKSYGGEMELSLHSPFYLKIGAEKREQDGLRPFSVQQLEQPAEVPEPILSTTNNLFLKGGYQGKSISSSLTGSLSTFNNDHKYMLWDSPDPGASPATDLTVFSPDNNYGKLAGDLSWRHLPLGSVLALSGSYAHLTNSFTANDINLNSLVWPGFTSLNRTSFDGDIDYSSAAISLASNPLTNLDSKVYYRYLNRNDKSSVITFEGDGESISNANRLLSYQKDDAGIDLGYRLPKKTKLEAGYEYLGMNRSTPTDEVQPTKSTDDNAVYIGIKNSSLDWMTAKLRYKHLKRDSAELQTDATAFYYMDQTYDEWKLSLDFSPVDSLDLGLSFAYKNTDYDKAVDTRQNDKRKNVYLDTAWHMSKATTLSGFIGFEKVDTDANRLGIASDEATYPDFTQTLNDSFWTYGLAANVKATDKLAFNLAWQYQKSDGQINFDNAFFTDVTNSDDYTKQTLEAKATYAIDPKLKMTVGYIYEKLNAADISYNNYQYILDGTSGTPPVGTMYYYSGLYANPNYEANIGYVTLSYGF